MLLSEHSALKLEIKSLPAKEKDKLLLRLIAKDKVLTEHLHFKLLEDENDLVKRQEQLMELMDAGISELLSGKKATSKDVLLKMRKLNGSINHHFKVTRDLNSEMELRIHLLLQIPIEFNESIFSSLYKFNEKLNVYFVKTTASLLNKYYKMHEDLQFDLKESINALLAKIYAHQTAAVAKTLNLPEYL
ncbi:hypothetical protein [Pedobacter heparinus]|uniref:Uncharacterized protein n=1 Tax=Pedobacter heparinus (strain ATCC 13125 / DSM 2366 / CIP 104194 / JCM 7457 / NBRC 12017 / NCIMB 9290 / NRRL B-14731 / HIM 762-3) TaxID=485917 RepID=C6XU10_PEDHD|nr:hypothetical protein [Pedobacter heparinus]ACU05803.1 hypothetical protein Phep_3612 [Pedobacter heparinus DSM 2366]